MKELGLILFSVGVILFVWAKLMYRKNTKNLTKDKSKRNQTERELEMLVGNGTRVIRYTGITLIIIGAIALVFFS